MYAVQINVTQTFLLHIIFVLRTLCKISPLILYRKEFGYPMQISTLLHSLHKISPLVYEEYRVPSAKCFMLLLTDVSDYYPT